MAPRFADRGGIGRLGRMSAFLIVAAAALLTRQDAPQAPGPETYSAPVVRPFEPGEDFGREAAEGDAAARPYRAPLTAAVTVDAYDRSYEAAPTDLEVAYDQGVTSAEIRADQTAGPLDGAWRVSDGGGRTLYELVLLDSGAGRAEGAWRRDRDYGGAVAEGGLLTLEGGAGAIRLERDGAGWRGTLTVDGRPQPVTLSRPG